MTVYKDKQRFYYKKTSASWTGLQYRFHNAPALPVLFLSWLVLSWTFTPLITQALKSNPAVVYSNPGSYPGGNKNTMPKAFQMSMTQTATITGTYQDKKNNPIKNAQIEYTREGQIIASDVTDENGQYEMDVLMVGITNLENEQEEFLKQNKPNPFTSQTTIEANIEEEGIISIYDLNGKLQARQALEEQENYTLQWDKPTGIYIYNLTTNNKTESKKMIFQENTNAQITITTNNSAIKTTMKNWTSTQDTLKYQKDNTTTINQPIELQGDTTILQTGNPGPNEYNPIPNTNGLQGDTLEWNLQTHVYNDEETSQYTTTTPETWISNDTLYHIIQAGTNPVNVKATDLTDPNLEIMINFNVTSTGTSNQPPVAVDDNAGVDEDNDVTIDVLTNDYDPDGSLIPSSVAVINAPAHGVTNVNANGSIVYTP
ncbi:MAG: T9SS type A sorting domain-containing protein, partial [Bacteroidetes bacterium]|nr:T9SS type A sorting domain-containing protein [Bacteroidota bacterium]